MLLQGLATLGQVTLVPDLGVTQCEIKALITLLVDDVSGHVCGTLTLDLWAWCASPRISYPWLSYPSTRSRCHTVCEIKALITLLVYDDVLLK